MTATATLSHTETRFSLFQCKPRERPSLIGVPSLSLNIPPRPLVQVFECEPRGCPRNTDDARFEASLIVPNLYLGSYSDMRCIEALRSRRIINIVNVSTDCELPRELENECNTLRISVEDHSDEPIKKHFQAATQFIHAALQRKEGVLVHCRMGVSRSATIVIAFLMQYGHEYGVPPSPSTQLVRYHTALQFVRQRRSQVSPNIGFILALRGMEGEDSMSWDEVSEIGEHFIRDESPDS